MFTEYRQTANWEITTGSRPLHMKLSIDRSKRTGHSHLEFEVSGHAHPYLANAPHVQYTGDESHDPSLLPAAKYLQEEAIKILEAALREHRLRNKNLSDNAPDKHAIVARQGVDTSYANAWLEKSGALSALRPVSSDGQLGDMFEDIRQQIDALMPHAEELLKRHKSKAPKENPTEDELRQFHETIAFHTQRAMLSAQRDSRDDPGGGKYQLGAKRPPPRDHFQLN